MSLYADIILPLPLDTLFTYEIPNGVNLFLGQRVVVPFGRKKNVGFVWKIHSEKPSMTLKKIESVLDEKPFLAPSYWEWLAWASQYYLAPLGVVVDSAFPGLLLKNLTVEKLLAKKVRKAFLKNEEEHFKNVSLNISQEKIFSELSLLSQKPEKKPALLFGVTGSGKTEIYFKLIEKIIADKKQALFLVPEIGLTPQVVRRFYGHFGKSLLVYHSGLTENERLQTWLKASTDEPLVVIGTRSALFCPLPKLGGIFVDEEHDHSYKQEEGFRYQARDLAIVRGQKTSSLVVLGSATPSLESFLNAKQNRYHFFHLRERAGSAVFPKMTVVDKGLTQRMAGIPLLLSPELVEKMHEVLGKKQQVLLLYNRRGFARTLFCLDCKNSVTCPHCSVSLVYHKIKNRLLCHYCDYQKPLLKECPACKSPKLTLFGEGTETVEKELKDLFPGKRVFRLDRDSTQKKGSLQKILSDLRDGKIDILVGTQMLAKGHDIPNVTLVGVLDADLGLSIPDFRATEKLFQILVQVGGRAGRGEEPGEVVIQTYSPHSEVIRLACQHKVEDFLEKELRRRNELHYPPVNRFVLFGFSSLHQTELEKNLENFRKNSFFETLSKKFPALSFFGPHPALLEKIRGQYRYHFLLKGPKSKEIFAASFELKKFFSKTILKPSKWWVDVDPVSML